MYTLLWTGTIEQVRPDSAGKGHGVSLTRFALFPCPLACFAFEPAVLSFEPHNAIILDYQATLAQYINNGERLRTKRRLPL